MSWTEEKVNKLKELWGKGNTASQIAEIIGGISRNAVISHVQTNIGIFINVMPGALILRIVAITFIAPRIDDAPSK